MSMSPTARRTGALASTALATAALVGSLVVTPAAADQPADRGTPPAQAGGQGTGEAPGNRGTVKIHEVGTPEDDRRNEPHVCDFEIVGFGFPDDASLEITIEGHGGPNAGPGTFASTVAADQLSDTGDWVVDGPTLADGMYKLSVENTTAPGGPKQKVFKVDCPDEGGPVVGGDDDVAGDDDVIGDDTDEDVIVGGDNVVVDDDDDLTGETQDGAGTDAGAIPDDSTGATGVEALAPTGTQVLGAVLTRELPTVAAASVTPAAPAVGSSALARTGTEAVQLVLAGSALLLAGGVMVRLARRRALA